MARTWYRIGFVGLVLLLLLPRCAVAQAGPEQDMFRKAQILDIYGKTDQAVDLLKTFVEQYPKSKLLPDAKAALCGIFLRQKKTDLALAIWNEMVTTTSRPRVLWSVIAVEYDLRMKANPEQAKAAFVRVKTGDGFTPESSDWDRLLWCEYAARNDMPLFISEGMKAVLQDPGVYPTIRQAILPVMIAQRLYEPLMKVPQFEDALRLHMRVQDLLALRYNPFNWMGDDDAVYYVALSKYNMEEYANQMLKRAKQLSCMMSLEDAQSEVSLICLYYAYALRAGQVEISMKIHAIAQAELKRIGEQGLLQVEGQTFAQQCESIPFNAMGQQFNTALANKEYAIAKKLLTHLTLAAPDHPVTRRAQQQWDTQAPKE